MLSMQFVQEKYDDELVEEIFGFHTPSPDDVVLAARAQATGIPAAPAVPIAAPAEAAASAPASQPQKQTPAPKPKKQPATSAKAAGSRAYTPQRPAATAEPSAAAAAEGRYWYYATLKCCTMQ